MLMGKGWGKKYNCWNCDIDWPFIKQKSINVCVSLKNNTHQIMHTSAALYLPMEEYLPYHISRHMWRLLIVFQVKFSPTLWPAEVVKPIIPTICGLFHYQQTS